MRLCSLFEENDHGIANIEADVTTVVVGDRMTTLFYHEAMPVPVIFTVELFFDFSRDVGEVRHIMIFEGAQRGYDCMLLLILRHISPLN